MKYFDRSLAVATSLFRHLTAGRAAHGCVLV
jgi:hypothetical protein